MVEESYYQGRHLDLSVRLLGRTSEESTPIAGVMTRNCWCWRRWASWATSCSGWRINSDKAAAISLRMVSANDEELIVCVTLDEVTLPALTWLIGSCWIKGIDEEADTAGILPPARVVTTKAETEFDRWGEDESSENGSVSWESAGR